LEYGSDGKFSETASVFYRTVAKERVKRRFLILVVYAGNITLCRGQRFGRQGSVSSSCEYGVYLPTLRKPNMDFLKKQLHQGNEIGFDIVM
jgi:hypothetical protein